MKAGDFAYSNRNGLVVVGRVHSVEDGMCDIGGHNIPVAECKMLECIVGNICEGHGEPDHVCENEIIDMKKESKLTVKDKYKGLTITRYSTLESGLQGSVTFDYYKVDPNDYPNYAAVGFGDIFNETLKEANAKKK